MPLQMASPTAMLAAIAFTVGEEHIEHLFTVIGQNARSLIGDRDQQFTVVAHRRDPHFAAFGRKFCRVFDDID